MLSLNYREKDLKNKEQKVKDKIIIRKITILLLNCVESSQEVEIEYLKNKLSILYKKKGSRRRNDS